MPGPFFINKNDDSSSSESKNRNKEFENTIGNLLVAEFQVHKLRQRLKDYHICTSDSLSSDFMYKFNGQWYRISVMAEKYTVPSPAKVDEPVEKESQEQQEEQSTGFAP